jgi:hypothetical protein
MPKKKKKSLPLKFASFDTLPWHWEVGVAYGPPDKFETFAKEAFNVSINAFGKGHCYVQEGVPVILWVEFIDDTPTLVHELMHAVFGILQGRGLQHCAESEEAYTYTVGQLLTDILACKTWKKVA